MRRFLAFSCSDSAFWPKAERKFAEPPAGAAKVGLKPPVDVAVVVDAVGLNPNEGAWGASAGFSAAGAEGLKPNEGALGVSAAYSLPPNANEGA